jgi:hypothetical protein
MGAFRSADAHPLSGMCHKDTGFLSIFKCKLAICPCFGNFLRLEYSRKAQAVLVKKHDSFVTIHRLNACLILRLAWLLHRLIQPVLRGGKNMHIIKHHKWDIFAALTIVSAAFLVGGLQLALPHLI